MRTATRSVRAVKRAGEAEEKNRDTVLLILSIGFLAGGILGCLLEKSLSDTAFSSAAFFQWAAPRAARPGRSYCNAGGGGGAEHSAAGWADCPNLVFPSGVFPFLWDCFTYRRSGNLRNPGRWDSLWPNMPAGCACVLPPWNEWFAAEGSFCAKGWKTVPPMDDLPFASESLCGFGSKGCSEAVGNGTEHVCDAIQLKNRACFFLHEQV